jgi:hypothetical protein
MKFIASIKRIDFTNRNHWSKKWKCYGGQPTNFGLQVLDWIAPAI